jgi:hypothetical protein
MLRAWSDVVVGNGSGLLHPADLLMRLLLGRRHELDTTARAGTNEHTSIMFSNVV